VKVTSRVMAFPPEEHHLGPIRLDSGHDDGGGVCAVLESKGKLDRGGEML
jgi:hypothetical protein